MVQTLQQEIIDYSDAMDKEGSIEAAEILLMTLNPISKILKQAGYGGQLLRTIRMACLKAARKSGIKKHKELSYFAGQITTSRKVSPPKPLSCI